MSKKLTVAGIERMKADPARRIEVPDGLMPGLYLVIHPTGRKTWAVRYRVDGRSTKLTLGRYPVLELADARAAARAALLEVVAGGDPAAKKRRQKEAAPGADGSLFPAVVRLYLVRHAKPRNRRWREQARLLGLVPPEIEAADDPLAFVVRPGTPAARWQYKRVQSIARADVIEVVDSIAVAGAGIVANRTLGALHALFAWCIGRDVLPANPATGVQKPGVEVVRDRTLSDTELVALWRAADAAGYPMGRFVQMLVLTGQRRDEVAGMTWPEIDGTLWSMPAGRTKNGHPHIVPLSSQARALVAGLPRIEGEPGYLFTTTGATPVSGYSRFKRNLDARMLVVLRKEAERRGGDPEGVTLPPWRLHDIRRTVASGMARLGIDLPVIERVLNHVSGSFGGIVGVYQRHDFAEEKRQALQAWADFVTAAARVSR